MKFFILVLVTYLSYTLYRSNMFSELEEVTPTHCQKRHGFQGPEDILQINNSLLVSSSNFRKDLTKWRQGGIQSLNLDDSTISDLTKGYKKKLNIHGLAAKKIKEGTWTIYAINHAPDYDEVLVFTLEKSLLKFSKAIRSPKLYNLNSLTILDNNTLLVTRDHYFKNSFLKLMENFFRLGLSDTLYYNGKGFKELNANFAFANGIVSIQKEIVAISSMLSKRVDLYDVSSIDNAKKIKSIELDFFPDNITFDKDKNELFIAGHYKIFTLRKYAHNPDQVVSPSKGVSVNLDTYEQKLVFASNTKMFSGTSTLHYSKGKYFIGSIYHDYLIECTL